MSEELKYNEPWILQRSRSICLSPHRRKLLFLQHPYRPMTDCTEKKRNSGRTERCGRSDSLGETQKKES